VKEIHAYKLLIRFFLLLEGVELMHMHNCPHSSVDF
jgi:hypothetical protein